MVGLDVTMRTLITLMKRKLRKLNTKNSELIADMIDFYFRSYEDFLSESMDVHYMILSCRYCTHPELASVAMI